MLRNVRKHAQCTVAVCTASENDDGTVSTGKNMNRLWNAWASYAGGTLLVGGQRASHNTKAFYADPIKTGSLTKTKIQTSPSLPLSNNLNTP